MGRRAKNGVGQTHAGPTLRSRPARLLLWAVAVGVLFLMGCVSTPRVSKMEPESPAPLSSGRARGTVSVGFDPSIRVHPDEGGLGRTISCERFVEATGNAVVRAGLFEAVVPEAQADYALTVTVFNVDLLLNDPVAGYSLSYDVVAEWQLEKKGGGAPLFHEIISERGHANFGDAMNGLTRNSVAREDGARKNIAEGIRRLAAIPD